MKGGKIMCESLHSSNAIHLPANKHCCPDAKVFVEEICGNFNGSIDVNLWVGPTPNDYFQGTFTVTNTGTEPFLFSVDFSENNPAITVPPGNTISISRNSPNTSAVSPTSPGSQTSGKFCFKLFKRVFV